MVDMADGYVQVAPDSTGKKIDNTEITRADSVIVERQRVEAHDEDDEVLSTASIVEQLKNVNDALFGIAKDIAAIRLVFELTTETSGEGAE